MANNYFQFKQFTIFQDNCAMKVCTDACLFGALVANCDPDSYRESFANRQDAVYCLDIGTGTGLLSLMFAQKNAGVIIDAIEIDKAAAEQAKENFTASPWAERLNIFHSDILSFRSEKKYDLIISNPPFFEDDLRSPEETRNNAKHDTSLSFTGLLNATGTHLKREGLFAVLLPYTRVKSFIEEAVKSGLHIQHQILVKQTPGHDHFRGILFFKREKAKPVHSEIIIKNEEGNYTTGFIEALKDYYLHL